MVENLRRVENFVAQPYVCGAVGEDQSNLFKQLIAASPTGVSVLHDEPLAKFAASPTVGLERVKGGWTWGRYIARPTPARDALDASHDLGLAGFWSDARTATVHTDWLGTQDVFQRTIGDTVYWANRITPLAEFAGPLNADVVAWRMSMVLMGFWTDGSPFAEITRLDAGQRLVHEDGATRLTTDLPSWLTNPSGAASIDDLAGALETAVPRSRIARADLTLSGGLDSRLLLAASLSKGGARPNTWSTPHESGWDTDTRVAAEIALVARTKHHRVDYNVDDWLSTREPTLRRLEHATFMHNWLVPISRVLHARPSRLPVLDGLGGDVLLRYHDEVAPSERDRQRQAAWLSMGAKLFRESTVLRTDLQAAWEDSAFEVWRARARQWDDHPYAETVTRLLTRTNRAVAASPFRIFAPERRVVAPFIDPDVVRVALAVPPLSSNDRDLRPRILQRLSPRLADIGSNGTPVKSTFAERGPLSANTARVLVDAVRDDPAVYALFNAERLEQIASGMRNSIDIALVRNAAVLADWLKRWRAGLATPPRFD